MNGVEDIDLEEAVRRALRTPPSVILDGTTVIVLRPDPKAEAFARAVAAGAGRPLER